MQCGDLAIVKNGDYTGQGVVRLLANSTISACGASPYQAVIQGESQQGVIFQYIGWGDSNDQNAPHNTTLSTLKIVWGLNYLGVHNTLDNVDGGSVGISGAATDYLTVQNSDFGPCDTLGQPFNGQPADCRSNLGGGTGEGKNKICCGPPNHVLIENNVFHDYIYHGGGPHFECWWIAGGANVTFDGNKFYNCQTNGVSLGDQGNDANTSGTWYFQNNWCSNSLNQGCFKFGQLPYAATMVFRFNSFAAGRTITNEEPTNIANPNEIYVIGNVLGTSDNYGGIDCIQNAVYDYNLELQGGNNQGCGTHRTIVGSLPYVNPANLPAGDYHLSGTAGSSAADNYVPPSAVNSGLGYDRDEHARPHDPNRDAGASER